MEGDPAEGTGDEGDLETGELEELVGDRFELLVAVDGQGQAVGEASGLGDDQGRASVSAGMAWLTLPWSTALRWLSASRADHDQVRAVLRT